MKKTSNIINIVIFLGIIFTISIGTLLSEKRVTSDIENRSLAKKPVFGISELFSGEYFNSWETYISDHIFARDSFIETYTKMNLFLVDRVKVNNMVLAEENTILPYNDYSMDEIEAEDMEYMLGELDKLNREIEGYGGDFYFVGVPGQHSFYRDRYFDYLNNREDNLEEINRDMFQGLSDRNVGSINMVDTFLGAEEEYYYRTDHHYNFEGAYRTYSEIVGKLIEDGKNVRGPLKDSELDIVELDKKFLGSRNRELYYIVPTDEKIRVAYPKDGVDYEKYVGGELDNDLYKIGDDNEVDYEVYMGGDIPEASIKTYREELPNALIFGDSYTNAIEPLLYYHFNETRILDLRHYSDKTLYEYIDEYRPDIVLMVRDDGNYTEKSGNGDFKRAKDQ